MQFNFCIQTCITSPLYKHFKFSVYGYLTQPSKFDFPIKICSFSCGFNIYIILIAILGISSLIFNSVDFACCLLHISLLFLNSVDFILPGLNINTLKKKANDFLRLSYENCGKSLMNSWIWYIFVNLKGRERMKRLKVRKVTVIALHVDWSNVPYIALLNLGGENDRR